MLFRTASLWLVMGFTVVSAESAGQLAERLAGDPGVLEFDGTLVQVSAQLGTVAVKATSDGPDPRLALLAARIESYLVRVSEQEEQEFSDDESVIRGTNYAKKLLAQIQLLRDRISHLGDDVEFSANIKAAAAAFDVPRIKQYLHEKLKLEDDNVAEAAFQLGGFQELDGEYQDAWGNYQKASNLEPDNQLYMDAHGKNEF